MWVGVHVCVCVRVYIFMQWVFKELSTEAGFPQTIITSTPDKPNFLSWMEDEAVLDLRLLIAWWDEGEGRERGE